MKRVIILFSVLFLQFQLLMAQNIVTGTLIDSTNNEKLSFVNVGLIRVVDSAFVTGAASDEHGFFKLMNIPSGQYNLIVSAIGYQSFKKTIDVSADLNFGIVKMKPGTIVLDDIVITEKKPLFVNEGEKTLYNVKEDPSVQTGTASDALQNAPGVEVDVEGNITLRGVSSVEVWINGQPSNLNDENLKTYLQQMPANAIDKIEVITNPSARYASKSDGGIINIVTNSKIHKNEFISFGLRTSSLPNISPWASYVYANEKISFNVFLNCSYYQFKNKSNGYSIYFNDDMDTTRYMKNSVKQTDNNYGGGCYFNFDYKIDTMNNISAWIGCWPQWGNGSYDEEIFRLEYIIPDTGTYNYTSHTEYNDKGLFFNGGLQFLHKFNNDGHNISLRMSSNLFNHNTYYDYHYHYEENNPWKNKDYRENSYSNDFGIGANVDYSLPYSKKGELGIGASYSHNPDIYYVNYDTLVENNNYAPDSIRSFDRNCGINEYDVYFTLQYKFNNFIVKPGIRMEYKDIYNNISGYEENNHNKSYLNWRPSLHISYRTKSMHNFKLSYSRRITPPDAKYITDFKFYEEESYKTGDLDLQPTYTNSFEGGWTKYWEKFGYVGLTAYYKNSTNIINNVTDVIYDDFFFKRVVNYSQPVNVGKSFNAGLEANITYRPNAMFNMRLYANIYDSYFETLYKHGEHKVKNESLTYSFRLNLWTKLWNKFEIHASGRYRSPQNSLFMEKRANYSINCGLRADFFKRKLSVYINANDIFNWNKWDNNTTNPYYISYNSRKYNSRYISVGFVLRFGNIELEKKARTNDEEENLPTE